MTAPSCNRLRTSEMVYFIEGGKVRIDVGDEAMELDVPNGHSMKHEPWIHRVENIGDTDLLAVIFERE